MIYLDTSVVAAYYWPEALSGQAERLVRSVAMPSISDLTEIEFLSALSRKTRAGELKGTEARRIATQFETHLSDRLFRRVPIERRHFENVKEWMLQFKVSIRALDALHVAVAATEGLRLATFDRALADAARALGLRVAGGGPSA